MTDYIPNDVPITTTNTASMVCPPTIPSLTQLLGMEAEAIEALNAKDLDWDYSTVAQWINEKYGVHEQTVEQVLGTHYDELVKP